MVGYSESVSCQSRLVVNLCVIGGVGVYSDYYVAVCDSYSGIIHEVRSVDAALH